MQNDIKLKRQIEETFKSTWNRESKYIHASSSEELALKIQEIIQTASEVIFYEFLTNSYFYCRGTYASKLSFIKELGKNITDIKIGHMQIIKDNHPNDHIENFAFGILDNTKECIKMICSPGEKKNIELSTYTDFVSLQDAVINIIGKKQKCNWNYMILRENENSFGRIEGTDQKRIESENNFFSNFEKCCESITAVSFSQFSNNIDADKKEELKHYVLFMV